MTLTTASIAHLQWMSSDSLNLSRFSGTSPRRSGSNPKSLSQKKKKKKRCNLYTLRLSSTWTHIFWESLNLVVLVHYYYPGAEPSRYGGRGWPGIHSAPDMVKRDEAFEPTPGRGRVAANLDFEEESNEGKAVVAMPQLIKVLEAMLWELNGCSSRCEKRVGYGLWRKNW